MWRAVQMMLADIGQRWRRLERVMGIEPKRVLAHATELKSLSVRSLACV